MTDSLPPPNNSSIDRAALDRILQRATELQTGEREIGDSLTPDEVVALGKEVGIPDRYLQQAMLEHRAAATVPSDPGLLERMVGPNEVRAERVVQGDPDPVVRALMSWMEKNELLVVQRQQAGWISWEPLKGMQAAIRRGTASLDTSKPKFMLSRAEVVVATVTPLENGLSHVSLTAALRPTRRNHLIGAGVWATLGGGTAAAILALGILTPVAVVPVLVGGLASAGFLRSFRPIAARVQLGLERSLDFLERGGVKAAHEQISRGPGLIELLANEVKRAITTTQESRRESGSQRRLPEKPK